MKTKLTFIAVITILVSACTTGTHMTKTYDDDIYFSPGDVPPVTMTQDGTPANENPSRANNPNVGNKKIVMSQMEKNADGTSTLNNYIYQPKEEAQNSDYQAYDMDQQDLVESDTTVYYNDDDVKYVVNNYYDENDNDLDYTYRINRFHRPYYYSPFFYDDWYYGSYYPMYSGYYGGWGWDPWYSGGWGYPYSYYGYYSPFSYGFGGYGGYYGGYGGYYGGGYGGYYGGYYGSGGYGGGYYNNHQVARRRATEMNLPGNVRNNQNNTLQSGSRDSRMKDGSLGNSSNSKLPTNGAISNTWIQNGHERGRTINTAGENQDTKNATIVNNRRSTNTTEGSNENYRTGSQIQNVNGSRTPIARPTSNTQGNVRRSYEPSTTGRTYDQGRVVKQSQNYTPSYSKPRIVNQSNYNSNTYTRPRTSDGNSERSAVKSGNTGSQTYSTPRSSSTMRQTYRSSSTYSNGSSSSSGRSSEPSYSSPSSSGSSPSYSAPSRSSGSSSGGNSSSGSSSGGGNSGGSSGGNSGGGSGHRR